MAILTFRTENDAVVEKFIKETQDRLTNPNLVKNPFHSKIIWFKNKEDITYILAIKPVYFNFTHYIWLIIFAWLFVFKRWSNWLILPMFLGCLGIFWSKSFYQFMLTKGLRKSGYKGKITFLDFEKIFLEMF